jgi:phosphoenolpyruvate synthase/pyruvate phosphate dikinase
MGTRFGENPCLLSVRSGSRASMPGMMDTVLNLGMNDSSVEGLIAKLETQDLHGILIDVSFRCLGCGFGCWS